MPATAVFALVPSSGDLAATLRSDPLCVADPGELGAVLDAVPSDADHVVLVSEQRHEAAVLRASAVLADAGLRTADVLLPHGPAAVVLLAREAAHVGADAGQLPALLAALAAGAWSGAWTPSVTNLEEPSPSFGRYVTSLLPGGKGYVVTLAGTERSIVPAKKVPAPSGSSRPVAGRTAGDLPDVAGRALQRAAAGQELVVLDWLAVDSAARFGHPRAIEAAALGVDGRTALEGLRPAHELCRVCGAHRHTEICPYCRVRPVSLETVPGGSL